MAEKDEYVPYGMDREDYQKIKGLPTEQRQIAMRRYYNALRQYNYMQNQRRRASRSSPWKRLSSDLNQAFKMTFKELVPGYDEILKAQEAAAEAKEQQRLRASVTQPVAATAEALRQAETKKMERYERKRTATQQEKMQTSRRRAARYGRRSLLSPSRLGAPLDQQGMQRTLG